MKQEVALDLIDGSNEDHENDHPPVLDRNGSLIDRSFFWSGGCAMFALILARRLRDAGQEADIAVISRLDGEDYVDGFDFELTHVIVSVSKGYVDVLGFHENPLEIARRTDIAQDDSEISIEGDWHPDDFEELFLRKDDSHHAEAACLDDWPESFIADWANRLIDAQPEFYGLPVLSRKLHP